MHKTELSEPPAPPDEKPGRKGRRKEKIVTKKTGEMKAELEAAGALVQSYLPPAPEKIQAAMAAGKITMAPGAGTAAIRIADYAKAGDSLTLTMDSESKSIRQIAVDTYLDKPDDKVTLAVNFQSLPDGTNYAEETVLSIPGDNIEVRVENSNYQKLAP